MTNVLALNNIITANAIDATGEVILRIGVVIISFLPRGMATSPNSNIEWPQLSLLKGPAMARHYAGFSELPWALLPFSHSTQTVLNVPTSVGRIWHRRMSWPK
jgi:hypothetical protein